MPTTIGDELAARRVRRRSAGARRRAVDGDPAGTRDVARDRSVRCS